MAEIVIGICERFHCLPSQVLKEDASALKLLAMYDLARPPPEPPK